MAIIPIYDDLKIQSPFLWCGAAGSDGTDDTFPGIHLRWDLMKDLGYHHIPKGTKGEVGSGYNQGNDFVHLYRTRFSTKQGENLVEFAHLDENNVTYLENDEGLIYHHSGTDFENDIIVRFLDRAKYRHILNAGLDPLAPVQDFLNRYDGIIEVEIKDKLMFGFELKFSSIYGSETALFETVTTSDRSDSGAISVVKREFKDSNNLLYDGLTANAENIKFFRVKQTGMHEPNQFIFSTYEDLFTQVQSDEDWKKMGEFSIELEDDNKVFTWFQGQSFTGGSLVLNWPKYKDGSMLVPENYLDRWFFPEEGLKSVAQQFITLSNVDPRANINYGTGDPEDPNSITVSLLDMLKMISLDYHAARMLGLGFLDNDLSEDPNGLFVYAAVYSTEHNLPGWDNKSDNIFITVPTSQTNFRLPVAPELNINYGLYVETDENNPPVLTSDVNGYSFHDESRYINLTKQNPSAPQPVLPSIPANEDFDATTITQPSAYGINYKGVAENEWRKPGLLYDDEYSDINGFEETTTVPEQDTDTLFTHRETEAGVHVYSSYAVNIFSRTSDLSNLATTNNTVFPVRNTLLPPNNFAAQYIQEEQPLVLTTQAEQNALAALNTIDPERDNNKTRVSFEWNNLHNNAFQFADKIEFYFRENPVGKVEGLVKQVTSLSATYCEVRTKSYTMTSANPPVAISPSIPVGQESRYIGSLFNTSDGQFQVYQVTQSVIPGEGPIFVIKKLERTEMVQVAPDEPMATIPVYSMPEINHVFFIFENVEDLSQWSKLTQAVDLVNFSTATETVFEEDGSSHPEIVGGINGVASITEIVGSDGGYSVLFNSGVNLNAHPDAAVSWTKGTARFVMASYPSRKKTLQVYSIKETTPIEIIVYDPTYLSDVTDRIQTGNQPVNFHPAYKVYLDPEPGVFDRNLLMPAGTSNNKKTYLVARSHDSLTGLSSSLTSPATILAKNIQQPLPPTDFGASQQSSHPDFFDKVHSTIQLTFDTNNRVPYGFVVYRASEIAILQALYKQETIDNILTTIAAIDWDEYRWEKWRALIEVYVDAEDPNQFYQVSEFRFPNPDNDSTIFYTGANTSIHPFPLFGTILENRELIRSVIEDVFISLTETPVVIEYLKTGYKPSAEVPKIRDVIGRLLSPSDTAFNPFPMAVKLPGSELNIRFSDFTLDVNATSMYFYFSREVSVSMKLSARTQVSGPVKLTNSKPMDAPIIRRVISREGNPAFGEDHSVIFEMNESLTSDKIEGYEIYRTTDFAKTESVTQMDLVQTVYLQNGEQLRDFFYHSAFPPYGETLYYRLVALQVREYVEWWGAIGALVARSHASDLVMTSILDVYTPAAPEITATIDNTTTNGNGDITALNNVSFSWPPTTHNATYSLSKMNNKGQWELLWSQKSNEPLSFPPNADFVLYPQTAMLEKLDADGNVVYHRFRVIVENASGLFNKEDAEIVL